MRPPFVPTSLRHDPGRPAGLAARLDAQLRERLEEAVDFVCLEGLVARRRARGLPAPAADSARELPDYWQRFEAGWTAWAADGAGGLGGCPEPPMYSGGERRGLLGRLFGRG